MEDKNCFRSEFTYDLAAFKEFNKLLGNSMGKNNIMRAISAACIVYLLLGFQTRFSILLFLGLTAFYAIVNLIPLWRNRDGGLVYKQVLHQNNGQAPRQIVTFGEDGIRSWNPDRDNSIVDNYTDVRYLLESKNLLVIVTQLKMCHIVDKRTLEGGSIDELILHLRTVCPKLRTKIRTGRLGKVITWFMWGALVLGTMIGISRLLQLPARLSGQLTNDVSYEEMAEELADLGITISQQTIDELNAYDAEYAAEYGDYYAQNATASKIADLLYWEGYGFYDEETWEWIPSESGVYWFDLEIYYLDSIYSNFLRGLDAMSDGITISNVSEDYTNVDIDGGTGSVLVRFDCNGTSYTLEAKYEFDWFDTNMLYELGIILNRDGDPCDLWYLFDGQSVMLYYGTAEQAENLTKKSGMIMLDPTENLLYSE